MDHALCLSAGQQEICEKHVARGGKPKAPSSGTCFLAQTTSIAMAIAILILNATF